jgi:hypothetical protein
MGVATGEAEVRGADYFGAVLNRAARVMAAGHGGQILLADSTASLLSGVDLLGLGPRRLRDLPTAIDVFQVKAADLGVPHDLRARRESGRRRGPDGPHVKHSPSTAAELAGGGRESPAAVAASTATH